MSLGVLITFDRHRPSGCYGYRAGRVKTSQGGAQEKGRHGNASENRPRGGRWGSYRPRG